MLEVRAVKEFPNASQTIVFLKNVFSFIVWMLNFSYNSSIRNQRMAPESLLLVTARCTTTTSALKLTSLRADVRSCVRVRDSRSPTEVLACLASWSLALHQNRVVASRRSQSQLIECDDLSTSLGDALASTLGDAEGADAQLGHLQQTQVIGDGANDDGDVALGSLALLQQTRDALQGDDWTMDSAHEQALQDDLVELLVSSSVQEAVELKWRTESFVSQSKWNLLQCWRLEGDLHNNFIRNTNKNISARLWDVHGKFNCCKICFEPLSLSTK